MPAGARSIVLPDCGHTPTWDNPELVAKVILEGSSEGGAGGASGADDGAEAGARTVTGGSPEGR